MVVEVHQAVIRSLLAPAARGDLTRRHGEIPVAALARDLSIAELEHVTRLEKLFAAARPRPEETGLARSCGAILDANEVALAEHRHALEAEVGVGLEPVRAVLQIGLEPDHRLERRLVIDKIGV